MVYKPRRERKRGGKAEEGQPITEEHGHQYNAQGSPEAREEDAKSDGFHAGGMMPRKKKRKEGGHVEGEKARHHLGRRARGGEAHREPEHRHEPEREERARGGRTEHKAMARGGSPFSSARKTEAPPGKTNDGPGEQAPVIP